jgi:hypothetical protein
VAGAADRHRGPAGDTASCSGASCGVGRPVGP